MRYTFTLCAALLVVGASALPFFNTDADDVVNDLDRDIYDFVRLVPQEKIEKVINDHKDDPELHKVAGYLLSKGFHNLVYDAEDLPQFQKYVLYLQAAGYNAIRDLRVTHKLLGMKDYVPPKPMSEEDVAVFRKDGGLNGYLDDFIAILPKKEIKELHEKKVKESPAFAKFKAAVVSPQFAQIRSNLHAQAAFKKLIDESRANGLDIAKIYSLHAQLLGFSQ